MEGRKAKSGFFDLITFGPDEETFIGAFRYGAEVLLSQKLNVLKLIGDAANRAGLIRYLLRATELYDFCVQQMCYSFLSGATDRQTRTMLMDLLESDVRVFPETGSFVDSEITCLMHGDIPYFGMYLSTGCVVDMCSKKIIGHFRSPLDYLHWHINNIEALGLETPIEMLRLAISHPKSGMPRPTASDVKRS